MKVLITDPDVLIGSHLTELIVLAAHKSSPFEFCNPFSSRGWLGRCDEHVKA
jgi:hypothetical protein